MAGRRGAWAGKPCALCRGRKGRQYAASKFCGNCKPKAAKASAEAAWATRLQRTYGITAGQYWKLYNFQGGRCYLCERATGKTKRLAVDHDHACCPVTPTCGNCVRGLLCGTCNKIMGHARDDGAFFVRGQCYLLDPPWRAMNREAA